MHNEFESTPDQQLTVNEVHSVPSQLERQADALLDELVSIHIADFDAQEKQALAIKNMGATVQQELAKRSHFLRQPIGQLLSEAEDGGSIGNSLIALQEQTDKINPNKYDFSMGTVRRLLAKLPGVGTPLSRWFSQYLSIDSVIQGIVSNLQKGQARLQRDNITLKEEQIAMKTLIAQLKDYEQFGRLLDTKITEKLEQSVELNDDKRKFMEESILFPLRQKILDLQQQLIVNQQGIVTIEVIIGNNNELISGVSRAMNVTVSALNIASTLAVALQAQKHTLNSVNALNQTTDKLIADTSKSLKNQGAEIHHQAMSAQLNIDNLKQAFNNIEQSLADISRFRQAALPKMSQSIAEMKTLTEKMDASIQSLAVSTTADIPEITLEER